MEMNLKSQLEAFKKITLELIQKMENGEFEDLDNLLQSRQTIIEKIENLNYSHKEFKVLAEDIDLLRLQKKLSELMNQKKLELRNEIDKISEIKNANKSYKSKHSLDSVFFSKKI